MVGKTGQDVAAYQRALQAWNSKIRPYGVSPAGNPKGAYFGLPMQEQVKNFQRAWSMNHTKYEPIPQTGWIGPRTHSAISHWLDAYGCGLLRAAYDELHPASPRTKIMEAARYAYVEREVIGYAQTRPMVDMEPPPNVPNIMDCSWFVTWCYKSAGVPDPNGQDYNGYGFTGTLIQHGREIATSQLQIGDLCFYGTGHTTITHTTVYVGDGFVISHGSAAGPLYLYYRYRNDFQQCRSYL